MLSYLCLTILIGYYCIVNAQAWISPSQELWDEINDINIYKAVVTSVNEWQRRQNLKKQNRRVKREDTQVCYENLGCFEASGPFGYLDMLPSKPEEIDTKFLLYPGHSRRRSGSPPAEVSFFQLKDAFEWAKQGFNKTLPTKVLIHGFGSDCSHIWIYEMRSALMAVEEVNVICVDWENGAILPNYVKATANTRLVGKQLAMLLRGLVENNGLSLRNTHLIGFSLGAHVAGFAGAELGNLSRITGLDPAGPLFESQDPRARLDQTDATFVDVIHSNGENLILGGLGSYQPMGHVDFYPNGGRMQKGCSNLFVGAVSDIIWSSAIEGRSLCNHRRAYKFFTDSVSPRCHFPAFPCDSYEDFLRGNCFPCTDKRQCGNMGYYADRSKGRGQLYLITRDEEPFCAHQYHVKIETTPSLVPIVSYGKIQITLIGDKGLNETFMMTRKEDDEMKLGDSISRILVPHPILLEPTQIEILYTAYTGWLSSGLTQWRMDKVTLSDSFGKISSICKKNLVLDSGVPVTLPLYSGECSLPGFPRKKEAQDRKTDLTYNPLNLPINLTNTDFVPTSIVRIGPEDFEKDKKSIKNNKIDSAEAESSRAFNTRIIKVGDSSGNSDGIIREIVEPILKPHSNKNARSHNLDKEKSEISEPILSPTTSKSFAAFKVDSPIKTDFLTKINNNKEISYNFYDLEGSQYEWTSPISKLVEEEADKKWKRDDNIKFDKEVNNNNPLEAIATTVQFLPQRLARMFEQAEKYARETILPLVSTYTPKFISDIITPPKYTPKYLPLFYEDETIPTTVQYVNKKAKSSRSSDLDHPQKLKSNDSSLNSSSTELSPTTVSSLLNSTTSSNFTSNITTIPAESTTITTPYTHIQKIKKKDEKSGDHEENTTEIGNEIKRKTREDTHFKKNLLTMNLNPLKEALIVTSTKKPKGIYIDLPVFDADPKQIKYIPLSYKKSKKL